MVSALGAISQQAGRVVSPGRHQALHQRSSPFCPEVHDELTKSWRAPYSSRICPSASAAFTSVDGAEEKRYEHMTLDTTLDESVATHLCPPTVIEWKARASHPSKLCRATSALAGRAYSVARQAASALHSMAVLQVFQAKMLASEDAGLDAVSLRDLRSTTDLALRATKATAQAIGRSISSPAPPLAHDGGDERGGQCSFPRPSSFVRQPAWTSCGGICGTLHVGSEVI